MKGPIYVFVFIMWVLLLVGGGLLFTIFGPMKIDGFGRYSVLVDSAVKAAIALMLVILWIFVMSKIKNWIFHRQIKH